MPTARSRRSARTRCWRGPARGTPGSRRSPRPSATRRPDRSAPPRCTRRTRSPPPTRPARQIARRQRRQPDARQAARHRPDEADALAGESERTNGETRHHDGDQGAGRQRRHASQQHQPDHGEESDREHDGSTSSRRPASSIALPTFPVAVRATPVIAPAGRGSSPARGPPCSRAGSGATACPRRTRDEAPRQRRRRAHEQGEPGRQRHPARRVAARERGDGRGHHDAGAGLRADGQEPAGAQRRRRSPSPPPPPTGRSAAATPRCLRRRCTGGRGRR